MTWLSVAVPVLGADLAAQMNGQILIVDGRRRVD